MTREEFGLWKLHPATQAFLGRVTKLLNEGVEELGRGTHAESISKTYLCIGKLHAYKSILTADFIEEEESDGSE